MRLNAPKSELGMYRCPTCKYVGPEDQPQGFDPVAEDLWKCPWCGDVNCIEPVHKDDDDAEGVEYVCPECDGDGEVD